uniref:G-protein coupled receptors family 1 profile domain-containing protein n=1 Tax=Mycena chlorophos TaxID=658473 RepID=A0ABQ0KZ67_MYCCL|nr:predicted protein [Mycena chlorophos]
MASSLLLQRAGPTSSKAAIVAFDVVLFVSLAAQLAIIAMVRVARLERMKTWYLLLVSGVMFSFSFVFLVGHQTGPEPPLNYCTFSAGLIYAAPPMTAAAALFLVIELHLRLSSTLFGTNISDKFIYWAFSIVMLSQALPFWTTLFVGLSDVSMIQRDPSGLYCHVAGSKVPYVYPESFFIIVVQFPGGIPMIRTLLTGTILVLCVSIMFFMEASTVYYLLRQRKNVKPIKVQIRASDFPYHLFVRTLLYTLAAGFAVSGGTDEPLRPQRLRESSPDQCVFFGAYDSSGVGERGILMRAPVPVSVAVVFGTQQDMLRIVFCWKGRRNGVNDADPGGQRPTNPIRIGVKKESESSAV